MQRKHWAIIAIVVIVAAVAVRWLLPDDTVALDEQAPDEAVVVRSGEWQDGDSVHAASGGIAIITIDGSPHLQFTDFEMTSGPDVYLYLTPSDTPRSTSDVEGDGLRIDVSTSGDPDAHLNERGSFLVPLDMDLATLDQYGAAAAWCDDFNVLFGSAALV